MESTQVSAVRAELRHNIDPKTRESGQRFFKEKVRVMGVKVPLVGKIAKKHFDEVKDLGKKDIFILCEELLKSGYMEEAFVAYNWAYFVRERYKPGDFKVFERWVDKHVSNWAECDTLCNHAVGAFIETYPEHIDDLKRWARSENRWMRRASAVSLILPARRDMFLKEVFEISDALMGDKDDLVQKGFGWLLKEAGKTHQKEVYAYLMKNKKRMPRTALRYAVEKFPENLRKKVMEK